MTEEDQHLIQARELLQHIPLIDGHNDFPFMIRGLYQNHLGKTSLVDFPIGQTDITRLRRGMVGGQFWSAYVPCPKDNDDSLRQTLQQIDVIHRMIETYPEVFGLAKNVTDIWTVFRSGRIASLIGIEGLHQIAESPSVLRLLYRLGVRYATLTHTRNNRYADSATDSVVHAGLSVDGKEMIREMNRLGMIVDLSHTSEAAQIDALAISQAPVIFSHSACYSLVPHCRNVTDKVLQLLKSNGGIIMICFLPDLVQGHATRADVIDHILYAAEAIGFDHVGIGSDFDGMLQGPDGLDDVSYLPTLVADLFHRGVAKTEIEKILGLNILRVLQEVEDVAQRQSTVLYDEMAPMWTAEQREILFSQGKKRGLR